MENAPVITGPAAPAPPPAAPVQAPPPAQGAAGADQQVAPPPKDKFQPRKFAPAAPTSSGLPDLLRIVSTQPFHTRQELQDSHVIPCTINIFAALATCDTMMVHTHKFTQSNPRWHPLISQLYVSILVYIHIIRCMMEANPTNVELTQFYHTLYQHLGLQSLVVPGPLVPFFTAIANSASPFEWLGNVSPTLPMQTGATGINRFRLTNRIYMVLPSIPFIIDQIHHVVIMSLRANHTEANHMLEHAATQTIFSEQMSATSTGNYNILTPNARFFPYVPLTATQNFARLVPTLGLPSRFLATDLLLTHEMNYYQFFGFMNYGSQQNATNWLTTIGPIMSVYSTFFQGSTSLLSISETGLGAILPTLKYKVASGIIPPDVNYVAAAAQGQPLSFDHIARRHPNSNLADADHSSSELSELAEQYASIAAVNCSFRQASPPGSAIFGPTNAAMRQGPVWTLPTVRSKFDLNTAPGIANNIASYYHSATPVRR